MKISVFSPTQVMQSIVNDQLDSKKNTKFSHRVKINLFFIFDKIFSVSKTYRVNKTQYEKQKREVKKLEKETLNSPSKKSDEVTTVLKNKNQTVEAQAISENSPGEQIDKFKTKIKDCLASVDVQAYDVVGILIKVKFSDGKNDPDPIYLKRVKVPKQTILDNINNYLDFFTQKRNAPEFSGHFALVGKNASGYTTFRTSMIEHKDLKGEADGLTTVPTPSESFERESQYLSDKFGIHLDKDLNKLDSKIKSEIDNIQF